VHAPSSVCKAELFLGDEIFEIRLFDGGEGGVPLGEEFSFDVGEGAILIGVCIQECG